MVHPLLVWCSPAVDQRASRSLTKVPLNNEMALSEINKKHVQSGVNEKAMVLGRA